MAVGGTTRFWDRLTNLPTDRLVEGSFWTVWCGFHLSNWSQAVKERSEIHLQALSAAERAERVWEASKKLFVKTCAALSGLSAIVCWATETSLIFLGSAFPYVSAGGYWASTLVSSSKIWDTFDDVSRDLFLYMEIDSSQTKGEVAFHQLQNLLKLAFFVCTAAWTSLMGAHVFFGGESLFWAADTCLYYGVILFCANFATLIIQPRVTRKPAS